MKINKTKKYNFSKVSFTYMKVYLAKPNWVLAYLHKYKIQFTLLGLFWEIIFKF